MRTKLLTTTLVSLLLCAGLSACGGTKTATPQPTGTAFYYQSLSATKLNGVNYISENGAVQLGQVVCDNLRADKSVMWIIRNIITLNGPNDGLDLSADDRYQFAIAVLASATTYLCPDMKNKVISPKR